jgi:hypothetical protein
MKRLVLILVSCLLLFGLISAVQAEKVVTRFTDIIDSPTSYVIPQGSILFSMRVYTANLDAAGVPEWYGAGLLIKLKTTPMKNFSLGFSVKEDGLIASGEPPRPRTHDVGILLKYRPVVEPISWAIGLDAVTYERWKRRRGLFTVFGADFKNTVFPYLGGNIGLEPEGYVGGIFLGTEITPFQHFSLLIDGAWISGEGGGIYFDAGFRFNLARGLWVEFDVRDIGDIIKGGEEWNRLLRIWYTWYPPIPSTTEYF